MVPQPRAVTPLNPWRALAIAACIAVIAGALVLAFAVRAQYQLESAIHESVPCGDEATERKVLAIMHTALDEALQHHVQRAFDVMMRNYAGGTNEAQVREQATRGVRGGVNAYLQAEKTLATWKLRRC